MGNSNKKPKGWHSRRHESYDAQTEARERYHSEHGRLARQQKAAQRLGLDPSNLTSRQLTDLLRESYELSGG